MSYGPKKRPGFKPGDASSGDRTDQVLRAIIDSTFGLTGEEFLKAMIRSIATSLGLKYAFVAEHAEAGKVRTMALWAHGGLCENITYDISGTPCENVINRNICYYPENVRKSFPKDHLLAEMGVESYLGAPLFSSDGSSLGLIAVLHDTCMPQEPDAVLLLLACSTRIASELDRMKAEQERLKITDELEKSINQRTYDLKISNEVLREQIVERMRAEDALRESEELYRALAEAAQDFIFLVGRDMRVEYMNRACVDLFAKGNSTAGKTVEEVFPLDMAKSLAEKISAVAASARPLSGEETLSLNGKRLWVDTRLAPVFDKDGGVKAVLGISRDITERMERAEELKKERDRAQMYLDIAGVLIIYLNTSAEVELINRRGVSVLNCPEKEILGRNWIDSFVPEKDRARIRECFREYIKTGADDYRCVEAPVLTKDGQEKLIYWTSAIVRDESGKIIGTLSSGEDITERKRNEEEREKLIKELQNALSNIKTLSGLLPICAACKKIRDDKGYWKRIETYIREHSEADFSHGICPDCAKKMY